MADAARVARTSMVDAIAARGEISEPVLAALQRVPREHFVPRFWALPPWAPTDSPPEDYVEWRADGADPAALDHIYDMHRALALRWDPSTPRGTTTTASAPGLMAFMLELLDLQPGMRILEIGTGSGYNAALLAEIVGDPTLVVSVDIDAEIVALARDRLDHAGYGDLITVVGDGYLGAVNHAPFDRVVATVGCTDLAPAWLQQVHPDGFLLIPLQHGSEHPLVRARPQEAGATGTVVGRAGFVAILGIQAAATPWRHIGRLNQRPTGVSWAPLPNDLAALLVPEPGRETLGSRSQWDLAYYVALRDERAALGCGLIDNDSSVGMDTTRGRIGYRGPGGPRLVEDLLVLAHDWTEIGRPSVHDYVSDWLPKDSTTPVPQARWTIARHDFIQLVNLPATSTVTAGGPR